MKQKKKRLTETAAMAVILASICTFVYMTVSASPGTDDDPLVTKSYLDSVLNNAKFSSYTLVSMKKTQQLICAEGTEFILRQGKGIIFSDANGGFADTTVGADLTDGAAVPANHLLICPVSKWRGFTATEDVLVLVKGDYSVIDQ